MHVLFYGNCQSQATKSVLNLDDNHVQYNIICHETELSKEEFDEILQKCDIIITQPISDNYRDKEYLSASYIVNNCKKNSHVIIFNSCYFNFYYFDLTYKNFNGQRLNKPIDYHYNEMINCYNNKQPKKYYLKNYVNNVNLKTKEELEKYANASITELQNRYNEMVTKYTTGKNNIHCISISEYVRKKYKNKLLFYSINHPTKYLFQFICKKIIKILKLKTDIRININYDVDPLAGIKCILYKCIQKAVNFNIDKMKPLMLNKKHNYSITELYYNDYDTIGYK